jgi:hypothetical protein
MVMDWREMAGRPTVRGLQGEDRWKSYAGVWTGGKQLNNPIQENRWDGLTDIKRGWIIALCWFLASGAE